MNQGRRLQTNKPSAPPAKTTKKAPVKPRPIPQKLPGEMSKEELDDAVKKPSKHSSQAQGRGSSRSRSTSTYLQLN